MPIDIRSLYVRYYQDPVACSLPVDGLRGFFWIRHEDLVSWPTVRALLGETRFVRLHLHIAPDPGSPAPSLPSKEEIQKYNITTSTWFEDKKELLELLEQSNVYFAPRHEEGIGQSFLEAMARGLCVIAPDNGTMNEYIINGLLYSPDHLAPLDFSRWAELGGNARKSVEYGAARWREQASRMVDFILTPSEKLYLSFSSALPGTQQIPMLMQEALRRLETGATDGVLEIVCILRAAFGDSAQLLHLEALALLQKGMRTEALAAATRWLEMEPASDEAKKLAQMVTRMIKEGLRDCTPPAGGA